MNELNLQKLMRLPDYEERIEVFVEALQSEINTDEEKWSKKGLYILKSLAENDANALLISLCGWTVDSIARKAMIIRDIDQTFHDSPVDAEMKVEWKDGCHKESKCWVNPQTHEVYDFDEDVFMHPENKMDVEISAVQIGIRPVAEYYTFNCVECKEDSADDIDLFWFRLKPSTKKKEGRNIERSFKSKHISEVKAGNYILFDGEMYKAKSDAYLTDTNLGKEWNFEAEGDDTPIYFYASEFPDAIVPVAKVEIVDFECVENLGDYAESMLYDSDTVVASMIYRHPLRDISLVLSVRGEVRVHFKGQTYTKPSDFPKELRELIIKHPGHWDAAAEASCSPVFVDCNNWFEFIYQESKPFSNKSYTDGITCGLNLEDMTAEQLQKEMIKLCEMIISEKN